MHASKLDTRLIQLLTVGVVVILVLIPFHALLTVWLSQAVGHYTLLRLWKEGLLVPLGLGAIYLLVRNKAIRDQLLSSKLTWLIAVFIVVQIIWGIVAYATNHVSIKALGYGLVSDTRYLFFFLIVWTIALKSSTLRANWSKLIFIPAILVIVFGLLQYFVLPYNFLTHLGYSSATIFPYEDINSNIHFIRIMSTLRGADPLGDYLLVVLSLAGIVWYKKRSWRLTLLITGGLLALIFSFSRAAWIGLILSLAVLIWLSLKTERAKRLVLITTTIMVVIAGVTAFALKNDTTFQNIFLHTQTHSTVATNSNQGHASALSAGWHDLLHNPLGDGPGTAGPASIYNHKAPARIAENYFIQIGQETGWLGLALFIAINFVIGRKLWQHRDHRLALGLLAALIGISFVNLLSHGWADDTLAYLWWGLAGIACSYQLINKTKPRVDDSSRTN
jgi:O-antigen ligase/polysaccharide polymerase Wzy-like membrane protein